MSALREDHVAAGPVSHDEAQEILSRFNASHWRQPGKEPARYSIPADPQRDDDIRLSAYIAQQRAKDETRAAELQSAHAAGVAEASDVREVLADLLSAINEDQEALVSYFADVGAEHERDCPEDDTCECELIVAMNKAHKRLAGAVHDATKLLEEGR